MFNKLLKTWRFVKLVSMWFKLKYWQSRCKDPTKLAILYMLQEGTVIGLQLIGWWVPKHQSVEFNMPTLQQISVESYKERANNEQNGHN